MSGGLGVRGGWGWGGGRLGRLGLGLGGRLGGWGVGGLGGWGVGGLGGWGGKEAKDLKEE